MPLPASGGWVRLEVPAESVGLEGRVVNGLAFTLHGGQATWDHAGVAPTPPVAFQMITGGAYRAVEGADVFLRAEAHHGARGLRLSLGPRQ